MFLPTQGLITKGMESCQNRWVARDADEEIKIQGNILALREMATDPCCELRVGRQIEGLGSS